MLYKRIKNIFIIENSNTFIQYFRFAVSGGLAAGISILTFYFLISFIELQHLVANSFSWCVGLIVEYLLNRFWVFNAKKNTSVKQVSYFLIISLGCLIFSNIVIYILVDLNVLSNFFGFENLTTIKVTAKIISVLLNSVWDFFAKKLLVFKMKPL